MLRSTGNSISYENMVDIMQVRQRRAHTHTPACLCAGCVCRGGEGCALSATPRAPRPSHLQQYDKDESGQIEFEEFLLMFRDKLLDLQVRGGWWGGARTK